MCSHPHANVNWNLDFLMENVFTSLSSHVALLHVLAHMYYNYWKCKKFCGHSYIMLYIHKVACETTNFSK